MLYFLQSTKNYYSAHALHGAKKHRMRLLFMNNTIFQDSNIKRSYFKLSIPLVLSLVVTLIYNLADTFFVAQTGDTNIIAGVSLGAPVFTLLMAFGNIFAQGGSSRLSILMGENKKQDARRVGAFCFYALLATGIVAAVFMLLFRAPIVSLLGATEDTVLPTTEYFTFLALGAPAVMISFVHSNLLRSEGKSTLSMIGTVGGALVNIILDPILISGLKMGAMGAAIATVIGYVLTDIYYIVVVIRHSEMLSMKLSDALIPLKSVGKIFAVGTPAAIVNIMQSVCVILINQYLLPFGTDKIAAMGIAMKVSMIALLILTGFAFGGAPLFGYYYGAKDRDSLRKLLRFCLVFILGLGLVLAVAIFFAAPALMNVFTTNQSVASDAAFMLRMQVITTPCVGLILLLTIIFQSFGKSVGSFILSISRQGVIFVAVLMLASHLAGYSGILITQAVSDVLSTLIAIVLFRFMLKGEFEEPQKKKASSQQLRLNQAR